MKVMIKWFDLARVCKKSLKKKGKSKVNCGSPRYSEYDGKPECKPENCPLLED